MERYCTRRQFLIGSSVALAPVLAGCNEPAGEPDGPGEDDVYVVTVGPEDGVGFSPQELEVQADQTVRWEWASDGHTVTPQELPADASWSGAPEPHEAGYAYEHSFDVLGPYQYTCDAHPAESSGVVHVRERANPSFDAPR